MKNIVMRVEKCGNNGWYEDGKKEFCRVSRWITVKQNYHPNKRNSLWYYVMDEYGRKPGDNEFNPKNGLFLDYFTYKGRNYAVEQFWLLGNVFYLPFTYSYEEKGKRIYLSAVDMDGDLFNPIYVEFDEYGEKVRIYEEI